MTRGQVHYHENHDRDIEPVPVSYYGKIKGEECSCRINLLRK